MIAALFGDLLPYIIGVIALFGGLWGKGRLDQRKGRKQAEAKRDAADARDYQATMERMSDEGAKPLDADAVRERMRARDPAKR